VTGEVLVTGGTGKTGRRLVTALRGRGVPARVASRSATGTTRFEWSDPGTFEAAASGVSAIYLVAPGVPDSLGAMQPFLEHALRQGIRRYVLLSASSLEEGGPMMGGVHAFLKARAPEWTALRPTWFMQNFSEQHHRATIRDERAIDSAAGDGRVAFIDAEDIAAVALAALLEPDWPSGDIVLTGPQTLSYDDVATLVSAAVGFTVTHRRLTETELAAKHARGGMPAEYASLLAAMDTAIAAGSEDRVAPGVERATGRPPRTFAAFVDGARGAWTAP
jgi:ergot alkaloid biosynthesis protein